MSVHLVGGGRDLDGAPAVYGGFMEQARERASGAGRSTPRIAVVIVAAADDVDAAVDWFRQALGRCGTVRVVAVTATDLTATDLTARDLTARDLSAADLKATDSTATGPTGTGATGTGKGCCDKLSTRLDGSSLRLADGSTPDESWFSGLDGLLVGGGLTPAYHRVLQPYAAAIRGAVRDGLPYAGFSAGAMIAPTRALLGGWRLGEVAVTHEDNAEDLDQLSVVDGLGLVGATVEVHTAQWGTLSRLVAAVADGAARQGIAIDENTVVILNLSSDSCEPLAVHGAGQAWLVETTNGVLRVDRKPAG